LILTGFGAALLLLTIMAMMIVSRAGTQPIRTVTATVASHAEQLEQSAQKLMSLNRDLALAAEQEQQSLQQLDFLKDVYSQDRTVQNLIESAAMHLDKAKQLSEQGAGRIEQSAMVCGDIAKHTGELMKAHNRMSKII
jgi:methyl-accepting chemotaxis protein